MRLNTLISIIALLTMSIQSAQAQDTIPSAPWQPENPAAFFADNVEIVSSERRSSVIGSTDGARVDLDRRLLIIEDGRVYPLPQTDRTEFAPEGGPRVAVFVNTEVYVANVSNGDEYWKLDLQTGQWRPLAATPEYLDTLCGSVAWQKLLYVPQWITITGSNNQQHLCNLGNGNVSSPLPTDARNWQIKVSNTASDYLELLPRSAENSNTAQDIFLYKISTRTFHFIAQIPIVGDTYPNSDYRYLLGLTHLNWVFCLNKGLKPLACELNCVTPNLLSIYLMNLVDGSLFIRVGSNSIDESPNQYYLFRLFPSENRIEALAADSYTIGTSRLERSQELRIEGSIVCEFTSQDLLLDTNFTYQIQTPCFAGRYSNSDYVYYRQLSENGARVDIVRVNTRINESEVVFQGEVEDILWISFDDRYATFVLDDTQVIDIIPGEQDFGSNEGITAQAVLLELATKRVIRQLDVISQEPFYGPPWIPYFYSVTDQYVAIGDGSTTTLLDISTDDYPTWNIEGRLGSEVVDDWVFLFPPRSEIINEYSSVIRMSAYNLDTHRAYPLIDLVSKYLPYYLADDFKYLGDNLFEFTVGYDTFPNPDPAPPLYNLVTYTVRLQVE